MVPPLLGGAIAPPHLVISAVLRAVEDAKPSSISLLYLLAKTVPINGGYRGGLLLAFCPPNSSSHSLAAPLLSFQPWVNSLGTRCASYSFDSLLLHFLRLGRDDSMGMGVRQARKSVE